MATPWKTDLSGLKALEAVARRKAEDLVRAEAEAILEDAKQRCPVDTGTLRDSLTVDYPTPLEAEIHDGVEYGIVVEHGGVARPARPFLTPAGEYARSRIEEGTADAMQDAVREVSRS